MRNAENETRKETEMESKKFDVSIDFRPMAAQECLGYYEASTPEEAIAHAVSAATDGEIATWEAAKAHFEKTVGSDVEWTIDASSPFAAKLATKVVIRIKK